MTLIDKLLWMLFGISPVQIIMGITALGEQDGKKIAPNPKQFKPRSKFWKRRLLLMVKMTDSQFVTLSPEFVDKKGNPADVQNIQWSTDNTDVLLLEPSADGKQCKVSAIGPLSPSTVVTLKADADLGDGEIDIMGTEEFNIVGGAAVTVKLNADSPQEQP